MRPAPVATSLTRTAPAFRGAETQRYIRARPRRFRQMGRYLFRRIRKDDGLAEPEPLHDPKQPFQKRNTEKNAERVREHRRG